MKSVRIIFGILKDLVMLSLAPTSPLQYKEEDVPRLVRTRAACLLKDMIAGRLTPEHVRDAWPESGKDKVLGDAFCYTYHWESDWDIRLKDPGYEKWQVSQVNEFICALELGAKPGIEQLS